MWGDVRAALFFWLLLAPQLLMSFSAEAEQIKLGVTLQLPITSHIGVNIVQFKEEVQRRTKGVVVVEVHDNSRLYKDDEVIAAVASGVIELGITNYNQFSKKVPLIGLPFLLNTEALVKAATSPDGEIRKLLDEAMLKATGTRVLWCKPTVPACSFPRDGTRSTPRRSGVRKFACPARTTRTLSSAAEAFRSSFRPHNSIRRSRTALLT